MTPLDTPHDTPPVAAAANPLLQPWDTPFGIAPFAAMATAHFEPAFAVALARHRDEVDAIATAPAAPTFANTAAALDRSGRLLSRVAALFHNLCGACTSPALQAVERAMAPQLAAHRQAILLDPRLYARLDALHAQRQALGLDAESLRLLERQHLDMTLAGAALAPPARARLAQIAERLAVLQTRFAQNVLADEDEIGRAHV